MRSPVKKKERLDKRALTPEVEDTPTKLPLTPPPLFSHNKRGSIVWSTDGDDEGDEEADGDDDDKSSSKIYLTGFVMNTSNRISFRRHYFLLTRSMSFTQGLFETQGIFNHTVQCVCCCLFFFYHLKVFYYYYFFFSFFFENSYQCVNKTSTVGN